MSLFRDRKGIIPACDMIKLDELEALVRATAPLPFIQGYKVGSILGLANGLPTVVSAVRRYTTLPIIYDHQKFGTDVPDLCAGDIIEVFLSARVDAVIIFPQAGPETLTAAVNALKDANIIPMVGGEMTHRRYLTSEGGYLSNEGPERMYEDGVKAGSEYFIVPGTHPERIAFYSRMLGNLTTEPKFLFPGIGRGQGGDIVEAFRRSAPFPSYAIVGRGIYAARNPAQAAQQLWDAVEQSMT
jgi:orotidine-5'-phosphate decarboxylase